MQAACKKKKKMNKNKSYKLQIFPAKIQLSYLELEFPYG